jgi:hypothetical protein
VNAAQSAARRAPGRRSTERLLPAQVLRRIRHEEATLASEVVPTFCTTRGMSFLPLSQRKEQARIARREARAEAIQRENQRKRDARKLARSEREAQEALGRGARGAFDADSNAPQFEKFKGKHYNW